MTRDIIYIIGMIMMLIVFALGFSAMCRIDDTYTKAFYMLRPRDKVFIRYADGKTLTYWIDIQENAARIAELQKIVDKMERYHYLISDRLSIMEVSYCYGDSEKLVVLYRWGDNDDSENN